MVTRYLTVSVCFVLSLSLCVKLFAQNAPFKEEIAFLQGFNDFGARVWGMGGTCAANTRGPAAIHSNPARMSSPGGLTINAEIGYRSEIPWMSRVSDDMIIDPSTPGWVGITCGIGKRLTTGLSWGTDYRMRIDLGEAVFPGPNGGSGDVVQIYSEASIQQLSMAFSWIISRNLSLGVSFERYRARTRDHYGDMYQQGESEYTYSGDGNSVLFGLSLCPAQDVEIGLAYRPSFSIEGQETFLKNHPPLLFRNPFPSEWRGGCRYRCSSGGTLGIEFSWQRWKSLEDASGDHPWRNIVDLFAGLEIALSRRITVRCGHCTFSDPWKGGLRSVNEDQHLLTVGGSFFFNGIKFDFSLLDSHLIQPADVSQTRLMLGLTCSFLKGE